MFSLNLGNSQEEDKESEKIKEKGKRKNKKTKNISMFTWILSATLCTFLTQK